jgi:peroxiredoxin
MSKSLKIANRTLFLVVLFISLHARSAAFPPAQPSVKSLEKLADSLFNLKYEQVSTYSLDKINAWVKDRTSRWESILAAAGGLKPADRSMLSLYGKAKLMVSKSEYVSMNPWAKLHTDALSPWVLDGQDVNDPVIAALDPTLAYQYLTAMLDAKIGRTYLDPLASYSVFSGRINEYTYLLKSNCPDSVKHRFLNFMLPVELHRNRISLELSVMEPYIYQAFKDPAILHYYDSILTWYHRLDKGQPAPDFTIHDYNGKVMKLADFRGKKLVIDTWATWCHSCIERLPNYDSLAAANKDPNTVFITFSIDDIDSSETSMSWRNFVTTHHMDPASSFHATADNLDAFRKAYGITEVPHYFMIDKAGKIVTLHSILPWDPEFLWYLKD